MKRKTLPSFLFLIGLVLGLTLVKSVAAQGAKPPNDKETIQELLAEVRLLRQALQTIHRANLDTYRSQLLVDQIRASREDVRRMTTSLNETRDQLIKTQNTVPQFVERQKFLESRLLIEADQTKRSELEFELKRTKEGIELYKSQIDPMKEREQQMTADLNAEKTRLRELEGRLELLERGIENDRQKLEDDKAGAKSP